MIDQFNILAIITAYLLGSIPTAVWIGKYFYKIDVREYGSGNAGATNTFRVLGKKAGIPVLIIDVLKGFTAVNIARLSDLKINDDMYVGLQLVLGIAALMGHIFPVFASFRGGKGIATLLGVILAVHAVAALSSLGVFLIVFTITNYVSLGSMAAGLSFPFWVSVLYKTNVPSLVIFSFVIAILVLVTHQKNIERLLRREENKMSFIKKANSSKEDDD